MDRSIIKYSNNFVKIMAAFVLLIAALLFTTPVNASSREVNPTVNIVPATQLAYYGGYYHYRHGYWRGWHPYYRWNPWHRGYYHWRRY